MESSGFLERVRGFREEDLRTYKVVKLGGSLITYKDRPLALREDILRSISREIKMAWDDGFRRILIIHGGGSFGHYIASKVISEKGFIDPQGFSDIAWYMNELNREVVRSLREQGLPAVQISTRGVVYERGGSLNINTDLMRMLIDSGLLPVLFGDVIICEKGFRIVSGDELAWISALGIGAEWVLFASTVDGVYEKPPEKGGGSIIRVLRISRDLNVELGGGFGVDVTGGMRTKILSGRIALERGVRGFIFNGLKPGNVYRAIVGLLDEGTVIEY
ncbi:MAG: isopentenyl phosphate kinase [Sulfolobales archaeon]